jgi:hypothetical protein
VSDWLASQLQPARSTPGSVVVLLDPERILRLIDLVDLGEPEIIDSSWALRRAFELHGRGRDGDLPKLVLLVHASDLADERRVPFDIATTSLVIRLRVPVPPLFRQLIRDLPDELADRAVAILSGPGSGLEEVLNGLWGVSLGQRRGDPVRELDVLIRLRTDPSVPASLWPLLVPEIGSPHLRGLAREPIDAQPLQRAWGEWLRDGGRSPSDELFRKIGPRISALLHSGLLRGAPRSARDLPNWVAAGAIDAPGAEVVEQLLLNPPLEGPPNDSAAWIRVAEWWGALRAALGGSPEVQLPLRAEAWARWLELDGRFGPWLRSNFGGLAFRATPLPLTLDKVAAHLAKRRRELDTKILMIVLDGMGFAQWASLRESGGLKIEEAGASFAMIPTLTPVSRQAIFAGVLPREFPESLRKTTWDARRWEAFWRGQGTDVSAIRYTRVSGTSPRDVPAFDQVEVVGMVVNAVDEFMHGSHVLGDVQVASAITAWARRGFIRELVGRASESGFEVWITADHGNLETEPLGRRQEGLKVETAGVRVRWYSTPEMREARKVEGILWDPPGLPPGACFPLFAPGRGGYFSGDSRVTHGGLSIDEVIVPLVRVSA